MAGDWIKVEHSLAIKEEVFGIARRVRQKRAEVVGRLIAVWSWADQISVHGGDLRVTCSELDEIAGCNGFSEAMRAEGWLSGRDGSLHLPNFERHNGSSAKARALEAEAKRLRRLPDNQSDEQSDDCPTKSAEIVRPEERRGEKEKIKKPPSPKPSSENSASSCGDAAAGGDGDGFRSADWDSVSQRLISLGVADVRGVLREVRENGIEPVTVQAIINHYVELGQWEVGALVWRLKNGTPEQGPKDGWPKPQVSKKEKAKAFAAMEESKAQQQLDSLRRKMVVDLKMSEARSYTDKQIVAKARELELI